MKSDDTNEKSVWVIKDSEGNFAHRNSIGKSKHGWIYIAFRTFSERECRGYITEKHAEVALIKLNKMKFMSEFDINFHIEYHSLNKIIIESKLFQGKNLVVCEKLLAINPLIKAI